MGSLRLPSWTIFGGSLGESDLGDSKWRAFFFKRTFLGVHHSANSTPEVFHMYPILPNLQEDNAAPPGEAAPGGGGVETDWSSPERPG